MRFLTALFLSIALTAAAAAQDVHIAATVNDEVITTDDLNSRTTLLLRSSGITDDADNRQRLAARVLRTLIDEKLEMQEAKELKVTVSKDDVDQALARIEQQNKMQKGGLDQYLQAQGVPRATLVDQLTASIAWGKIVQGRLMQDVAVSDQEVSDALKRLQETEKTPLSDVSEIFLAVDNPSQDDEVKRLADRLEEQLRGGGNFATIAQQFSQSPTAAQGGKLGWVTPSEINPALAQALTDMKIGELSPPIRTSGGYYILALGDRRLPGEGSANDAEISVVEVGAPLPPKAPAEFRTQLAMTLRQVTAAATSCPALAAAAHKIGLPFVKEAPNIKAATLATNVRRIALSLSIGEISKPFAVEGGVGMVMMCDRKAPPAAKPPTADEIRETIGREHLDVLARRYLRDLRRGAYVDIRG